MSDHLIEPLHECGVVPFIRTRSAERANRAVEWLSDAGFRTFELAASICGIVELVEDLSSNVEFDVGVGMVMDRERARACIEAGASYIVTPGIVADVVEPCREAGVACVLGASTPSEIMRAHGLGADAVKVFPAGGLGGVRYVKTLKAMFPDTPLAPAGGIAIEEIASYLRAGAAFVGVGRELTDTRALCTGDKDTIIDAAASALDQAARANAAAQQEALRGVPTAGTQDCGPRVSPFPRRRPIAHGRARIRAGQGFREG